MKTAAVVVPVWKMPIFKAGLTDAKFHFKVKVKSMIGDEKLTIIKVSFEHSRLKELTEVVKKCMEQAELQKRLRTAYQN